MHNSSQETRSEFKRLLDLTTNSALNIYSLQNILSSGQNREIIMSQNGILLRMKESERIYNWDPSDPRTAITCLVAYGEYEPLETKVLSSFARGSRAIIDVGANVGYYSIELNHVQPKEGKLVCFEPVATTCVQLERNIELNKLQKMVTVFNLGLSDRDLTTTMFLPKKSGSSAASARNLHPDEEFTSQVVMMTSLDKVYPTLGLNGCDLIKIDVEGGELNVIQGALETIKRFRPVIFAELLRKWSAYFSYDPNEVLEILQKLNYICFGVSTEFRRIEKFKVDDFETNFVFVHEDSLIQAKRIFDEATQNK